MNSFLAQVGADLNAVARGGILLLMVIAVALAVLVAALSVFIFALSHSPRAKRIILRPIMIIPTILVFVVAIWSYLIPRSVVWDISQSRDLEAVGWPPDRKENWYYIGGNSNVVLKVSSSKTYVAQSRSIWIDRRGEKIQRIKIAGIPMTLDEAVDRLKSLDRDWGFGIVGIEGWVNRVYTGGRERFLTCLDDPTLKAEICAEIVPSANDGRPWYIMFTITWPTNDGMN